MNSYKEQISAANERLIDSIAKVTELLKANQMVREELDGYQRGVEQREYELYGLNQENNKLRERIEVLETLF